MMENEELETSEVTAEEKGVVIESTCEEVLLPASSTVSNGAAEGEMSVVEYLEENDPEDPEDDPMEEDVITGEGDDLPTTQNGTEEYIEEVEEEQTEEVDDDVRNEDEQPTEDHKPDPKTIPKKRKDLSLMAAVEEEAEVENVANDESVKEEEQPTSSVRSGAKESTVDEEQCRVCTSKDDLVSLFKNVEEQTVADMLMTICPTVSIAPKDFMPQFICNTCLDNVTIAVQLKAQCENTERELRKQLSRSKNKVRRPTGYVVIDAPVESDPPTEEEEATDDAEFKVSDEASASADDDSEDSDFSTKKKRPARGGVSKRGRRKPATSTPASKGKPGKRMGRMSSKRSAANNTESSDDEVEEIDLPFKKKRNTLVGDINDRGEYACDECDHIFARKLSLVLHKKSHNNGRGPLNCDICGKQFKIVGAYRTHLEKHKEDATGHGCDNCNKIFANKVDLRRHLADDHNDKGSAYQCAKCKRVFASSARLARHKEDRCPGFETKHKKNDYDGYAIGKDLFKSVAPLTTTYWSDSFSD